MAASVLSHVLSPGDMGLESPNDNETLPPLLEVVDNLESERMLNNSNFNAAKLGISLASDRYDNKSAGRALKEIIHKNIRWLGALVLTFPPIFFSYLSLWKTIRKLSYLFYRKCFVSKLLDFLLFSSIFIIVSLHKLYIDPGLRSRQIF